MSERRGERRRFRRLAVAFGTLAALLPMLVAARAVVRAVLGTVEDFRPPRGAHPIAPPDRFSPVSFAVGDATIRGYFADTRNGAAVILAHGSGADCTSLLEQARLLCDGGYGVLLFDWPGHGASDGRVSWSHLERETLRRAFDVCASRPNVDANRIAVLGFSFGSYIVLQVAAEDSRFRAVVVEGAFTTTRDLATAQGGTFAWLTDGLVIRVDRYFGMDVDHDQPLDVIHRIAPRPILIVTGTLDDAIPTWMSDRLLGAAGAPKDLWRIVGAHHGDYANIDPVAYTDRVVGFLDRALLGPQPAAAE